ncbi:hypothetical protein MSG28_015222 [Choristoneura fumiferana]|uniref:Uncharacterized protein n=1 Tax=Choristoneura fumiferana TaxID=7141 RepID=A0ACC0KZE6_CHOFU|nr:hypothetical protein MSG28_015222 [Choristoneura fumiferana]
MVCCSTCSAREGGGVLALPRAYCRCSLLVQSPEDSSAYDSGRRDDDSEASSVCSERSLDSYRRHDAQEVVGQTPDIVLVAMQSVSWSGSASRLGWEGSPPPPPPPDDIIALCASTHWTERKDGLTHLANYLNSGRLLTDSQLRRLTELLNKMFVDAHTKVFSLLLDAVCELLLVHWQQLKDWLYQLVFRLLMKLGTDILGSVQSKIMKTLDVIHECFPPELQLHNIFRFLADGATAPTAKTKAAALRFLAELAHDYCTPNALQSVSHLADLLSCIRSRNALTVKSLRLYLSGNTDDGSEFNSLAVSIMKDEANRFDLPTILRSQLIRATRHPTGIASTFGVRSLSTGGPQVVDASHYGGEQRAVTEWSIHRPRV